MYMVDIINMYSELIFCVMFMYMADIIIKLYIELLLFFSKYVPSNALAELMIFIEVDNSISHRFVYSSDNVH